MEKIYVFGHRNPDTDSVTASIALAHLKKELGVNAVPVVLSNINNETKYALNYFNVTEPNFLNDVKLKIKDIKYKKNYFLNKNCSLLYAYNVMVKEGISKLPIVSNNNTLLGVLSMKDITKYLIESGNNKLNTNYQNIVDTIDGEVIKKFDEVIDGNLLVASYKSTTFIDTVALDHDSILIVGDRHSIIEYAINSNIKLLILSGNSNIKEEHLKLAHERNINIIKTKYSSYETARRISLANTIESINPNNDVICVNENDSLDNFINMANKTKYSYYPVVNNSNKCLGIITLADISEKKPKKVILVDHNTYSQSIEGIEEACILEVIDHHNLGGNIGTKSPINFRNCVVGSTNTIIYQMYRENNIPIPRSIAGIMASGIISDTLILKSPTTTDLDRVTLANLSKIAEIDYLKYGIDLLKAGANVDGRTKEELLYQDFKVYPVKDTKIGIGQISTTDPSIFLNEKSEYQNLLNAIAKSNGYLVLAFFVSDILNEGSYVLFNDNAKGIISDAFNVDNIEQGHFLSKVVSRKLQIIPVVIEAIEQSK